MFSTGGRNESKCKLAWMKACEAEKGKRIFCKS